MKHGTSTAAIFLAVVAVVILALVIFLGESGKTPEKLPETVQPDDTTIQQPEQNLPQNGDAAEEPEEEKPEEEPEDTEEEEVPEEEPEQEEPEQEEPDVPEEPEPEVPKEEPFVPTTLGSGSFRSDTGVPVNLVTYWSAKTIDASTVEFTVDVYVESYTLQANASPSGLIITVYGARSVVDLPELMIEASNQVQTHLATRTYTVNLSDGGTATVPVKAEWLFGGVYSGKELPVVECGGDAYLVR